MSIEARIEGPVTVVGRPVRTLRVTVPGIGTAAAYATGDAFGTKFAIDVPEDGTITNVMFLDYDDEGIDKELLLFSEDFAPTADNAAFAVSDADLSKCVGPIPITRWLNYANNQVGYATPALSYHAPTGKLYGQLVTRGADNIAAGAIPDLLLVVA